MTDISSRAPRRRLGYALLAAGPVAAASAIAMFIACQPAVASTGPAGLGSVASLPGLGSAGSDPGSLAGLSDPGSLAGLSGPGSLGSLSSLNGIGDTGPGPGHDRGDHCGCASQSAVPTTPPPSAKPIPASPAPRPAPIPKPVGSTFSVTG